MMQRLRRLFSALFPRWAEPEGNAQPLSTGFRLLALLTLIFLGGCSEMALFSPKGDIGSQEKNLILIALGMMLLVVIPVIVLTLVFAWRYRATNTTATYSPKWAHSTRIEVIVWTIPCVIVAALAWLIVTTTHSLDPYRPLDSSRKPVRVDVIALNWKWLFIYRDYGVASVNRLAIPVDTPIEFTLTAQSIMNSFFIPQLGSQIYAMAGMQTKLHLIANSEGTFAGQSSAYSGEGFSDMRFDTITTSREVFDGWIANAKSSPLHLDNLTYRNLEQPSVKTPVAIYASVAPGLFETVANQYMHMPSMDMAFNGAAAICTADGIVQRSIK